jgi:hypothetical protein
MRAAVIDIGKPGKNLGWFIDGEGHSCGGNDIDECIEAIAQELDSGSVALGFEAPLFVPVRQEPMLLLKARDGECLPGQPNRPFSAGDGASVLVTALVVVPYVLSELKKKVPSAHGTLSWHPPPTKPRKLLLFEAFVTDQRKTTAERHMEDAKLAVLAFQSGMLDSRNFHSAVTTSECFNLLGAMMLRTGWSSDRAILEQPCLVVRTDVSPKTTGVSNVPQA